jgi:hypothetical protein
MTSDACSLRVAAAHWAKLSSEMRNAFPDRWECVEPRLTGWFGPTDYRQNGLLTAS